VEFCPNMLIGLFFESSKFNNESLGLTIDLMDRLVKGWTNAHNVDISLHTPGQKHPALTCYRVLIK
jgi:hypothetical protein